MLLVNDLLATCGSSSLRLADTAVERKPKERARALMGRILQACSSERNQGCRDCTADACDTAPLSIISPATERHLRLYTHFCEASRASHSALSSHPSCLQQTAPLWLSIPVWNLSVQDGMVIDECSVGSPSCGEKIAIAVS